MCHGPAALLSANTAGGRWLFAGYQLTGVSSSEEEQVGFADEAAWLLEDCLRNRGGLYAKSAEPWKEFVIVERNVYTRAYVEGRRAEDVRPDRSDAA
ncbi:hypothetical protein MSAS_08840 [Mycobacterium saskatchewanense]|uniref:Uncharacterized protein n=1 Tax=Mycobacterium saskatchewanense TaxID=220927 RepID=A0AAJ3TTW1_9MYCO|nr:hypothetical protein AWC23_20100 [Mycobacterium saskatchewanense]BBX61710.1 hypothetical protein MSAS_08840 [Mycobacterium saskatchewanense]